MGHERVRRSASQAPVRAKPSNHSRPARQPLRVQAKLQVGRTDDPAEREADAIAAHVMRSLADSLTGEAESPRAVQRAIDSGRIRRAVVAPEVGLDGGELAPGTEAEIRAASSGGSALPHRLQRAMGAATGADLSTVRVHTDVRSNDLNRRLQAKAFTSGEHIHFAAGAYDPASSAGQHLIAHEVGHTLQQGKIRRRTDVAVIHRYTDVPSPATWMADSKQGHSNRSEKLKVVDDLVEMYDQVKGGGDMLATREALQGLKLAIHQWQTVKDQEKSKDKSKTPSIRQGAIDELDQIVVAKVKENLDAHELQLAPLVSEVNDAFKDGDFTTARAKSRQLRVQHDELYAKTVWTALRSKDNTRWATAFFSAPDLAVGAQPIHPSTIKGIQDFSWMSATQAEEALVFIEANAKGHGAAHIMGMLQHAPFRAALKEKAYSYGALEAKMPLLRVAAAAEDTLAGRGSDQPPTIDEVAEAVFTAFLGDQPLSGLRYATNSADFKTANFLVGDTVGAQRAPCMSLSNAMTEVFKSVLPSGVPGAVPQQDMRPMLTKPLASIGLRGILTREKAFKGNVERYGDVKGYTQVNRIFFGDGHEWLVVGNREYDPTLGISGPIGTIAAQLEALTFTKKGESFKSSDGKKVTRSKKTPPGGASLLFQRSVTIK